MFDFGKNDLYYRSSYDEYSKEMKTAEEYLLNDKIMPSKISRSIRNLFKTNLVLETLLGYIKVEDIKQFSDLFNPMLYMRDTTESLKNYEEGKNPHNDALVKRLSKKLGKHWNSN